DPKKYIEHFVVLYKKKFQRMYVSASSHSSMKFNMSWKVFGYILLFIMIILITVVGITKIPIFSYAVDAFRQITGQETNALDQLKTGVQPTDSQNPFEPIDQEHAASQPVVAKQQYTTNGNQQYQYDVSRPYDFNPPVMYEIQQRPRLAGCIASKSTCSCYTQQATKIDMSQSDCRRYVSGDRPFDYFAKEQELQYSHVQAQTQPVMYNQSAEQFDAEYMARIQEARRQGLL
ncbi:zonular occludens toxin, partial [Acinetobacter haemolyticus]|nr:zonular occludens toxin [Acinetobacter haemolyticus]